MLRPRWRNRRGSCRRFPDEAILQKVLGLSARTLRFRTAGDRIEPRRVCALSSQPAKRFLKGEYFMLLNHKIAVVYGAGGAIGSAVSKAFASEGARVFLTGRNLSNVNAVAEAINFA